MDFIILALLFLIALGCENEPEKSRVAMAKRHKNIRRVRYVGRESGRAA